MKKILILLLPITLLSCHYHENPIVEGVEINTTECGSKPKYKYIVTTTFGSFATYREYKIGDTLK